MSLFSCRTSPLFGPLDAQNFISTRTAALDAAVDAFERDRGDALRINGVLYAVGGKIFQSEVVYSEGGEG